MSSNHHAHANFHHKTYVRKGAEPFKKTWCHDLTLTEIHLEINDGYQIGDILDLELMLGHTQAHPLRFHGTVTKFIDNRMEVEFKDLTDTQKNQVEQIVLKNTNEPIELKEEIDES